MNNGDKVGKRIAMLRKEKKFSQEELAERLHVSAQAVSKWETGKSLPETATLPLLSTILGHSIDSILMPQELIILSACYTDGQESHEVTHFLNQFVVGNQLTFPVSEQTLPFKIQSDRLKVLLVKYETPSGVYSDYALKGDTLTIGIDSQTFMTKDGELDFIFAAYGNETAYLNVMKKMTHLQYFRWDQFQANHEVFPSLIDNEGQDYLLLIYRNAEGLHAVSCREGERIRYSPDRMSLFWYDDSSESYIIEQVDRLGFGKGMDCSWGGAMYLSLKSMGVQTSYEKIMGVSGACWRISFTPAWDYSSADALVAYDYAVPAFAAYGFQPIWADRISQKERKAEKQQVLASIRKHQLPIAINLRVAPEWGVITGYLNNGNTLLCRSYFDDETFRDLHDDPEFQASMEESKGYLYVDQWPFAMVRFGDQGPVPSDFDNLLRSLHTKVDSMSQTENRGYRMGYAALETWREGLLDEAWYRTAEDSDISRRLSVNHFCMMALTDARKCAAAYLRDSLFIPQGEYVSQQLSELAKIYDTVYSRLSAFYEAMPSDETLKTSFSVRQAWSNEQRAEQAQLLEWMANLERQGDELARLVLENANNRLASDKR
ncbi:helix-turn-helix domain-containing protein [Paenibacillus vini]|uniref:HTH cro/C1-type domain-containing protein n=1 Tax=Paenibacillus vini TaxID=1476024 RepID=A0ABQ4M9I9_9BACL|nr:helix-turn-helix transcriptional regulator [Paenibacillus vini]GIP52661.1 hypothetical protein J42TS3_16960 [Paenibacillus vini]